MSGYTYDPAAARVAIAAQLERDERERLRDFTRPDFAASVARAARHRAAVAKLEKPRVELPPLPEDKGLRGDLKPADLIAQGKRVRRKMERHESAAISIQTFIGPRTPSGSHLAETLRLHHLNQWKILKKWLAEAHPFISAYRANAKADAIPEAIEAFLDESEQATGMSQSVEEYAKQVNQKSKLKEMSAEICRRLESVGVNTKREDDCGLWVYWIHSKVWEQIDQYRRICINPLVAASSRAKILASLEYFLQRNAWCRFWTFTTGERCPISGIGERLDVWSRKLSKLNYLLRRDWGGEFIIATSEFGTLEVEKTSTENDEEGRIEFARIRNESTGLHSDEPLFHPHYHVVFRSLIGYRDPEKWDALCKFVRSFWGVHCDFSGGKKGALIRSAREVVKYVTKPGDLLKLTPEQLKAFYEATANRRLVRPMGSLRREIAERNASVVKKALRRIRVAAGRWEWVERVDHNQTARDTMSPEDRKSMDEIIDSEVFAAECAAAAQAGADAVEIGETLTLWDDGEKLRETVKTLTEGLPVRLKDKPNFCQVVAYIPPAAGPCRRKENRVFVMGNLRDEAAVNKHPLVKQLRERTWQAWAAGEALAGAEAAFAECSDIYVHTGTLSVPRELETPAGWRVDDPIQLVFETA